MDETLPQDPLASKVYDATQIESSIYQLWLKRDVFAAIPDNRPRDKRYVVMMPLPNVTGALHMGHAMDNVMQDLLIRWHRMQGDNTLWMPGTDHAGIATQAVVEKRLKELEGLTRHDLGRQGLIERIWAWKDQYQRRIVDQQRSMGCSCDWQRQRFTMDAVCTRAVRHAFFRMFSDGLIFRGKRLVNWDVFLQTSISDDEVYHESVAGQFWHLRYPIIAPKKGEPEFVVVATTRPETMLGDTAVAVHPNPRKVLEERIAELKSVVNSGQSTSEVSTELANLEERVRTLLPGLEKLRDMAQRGATVMLPLLQRKIPLICDEWAKPDLGSGCVKITPAHDPNDYQVWQRHRTQIGIINILNPDGTLNAAAGTYAGLDRHVARQRIVADLQTQSLLDRVEDRQIEIGHSDRSKTPIEPYLSDQWFILMGDRDGGVTLGTGTSKKHSSAGLVQAAIDAVNTGRVTIHPSRYTKTYLDWLAEKRDWPISRQLWWGHQIPIWSKSTTWNSAECAKWTNWCADDTVVRTHFPADERSYALGKDGKLVGKTPTAGESLTVDVCVLSDNAQRIAALEAAGFVRDTDVLDTWFSSALWPFSTLGWPDPDTASIDAGQRPLGASSGHENALSYYYPGSCLVTGRDIITLWVARMVIFGLYHLGDVPFSDVFIHANILDGKGERMSKSKGNGIDPVDIINRYGTDAMRFILCDMQTGSQDIRLPVTAICPKCEHHNDLGQTKHGTSVFTYLCDKCRGEFDVLGTLPNVPVATLISERFDVGRAFCTKLWNSARFALMNLESASVPTKPLTQRDLAVEDRWILDGMMSTIAAVQQHLVDYNPSGAINTARDFFWGSLCDWYLELIKPRLQGQDALSKFAAQSVLAFCVDQTLRLFHPFVPFITEHIWQLLNQRWPERSLGFLSAKPSPILAVAAWPEATAVLADADLRPDFADIQEIVRAVREVRVSRGVPPKQALEITVRLPSERQTKLQPLQHIVQRLANVARITFDPAATRQPGSTNSVAGSSMIVFTHGVVDDRAERSRIEQQLKKIAVETEKLEKRLGSESFTAKAPPDVVAEQHSRLAEFRRQKQVLEVSLSELVVNS